MNRKERRAAIKRGSRMPAAASVSPRAGSGGNAAYHFNLATSHQAAARWDKARMHFTRAIVLGMDDTSALQSVLQTPVIAGCLHRIAAAWPRPLTATELFGPGGVAGHSRAGVPSLFVEVGLGPSSRTGAFVDAAASFDAWTRG